MRWVWILGFVVGCSGRLTETVKDAEVTTDATPPSNGSDSNPDPSDAGALPDVVDLDVHNCPTPRQWCAIFGYNCGDITWHPGNDPACWYQDGATLNCGSCSLPEKCGGDPDHPFICNLPSVSCLSDAGELLNFDLGTGCSGLKCYCQGDVCIDQISWGDGGGEQCDCNPSTHVYCPPGTLCYAHNSVTGDVYTGVCQ